MYIKSLYNFYIHIIDVYINNLMIIEKLRNDLQYSPVHLKNEEKNRERSFQQYKSQWKRGRNTFEHFPLIYQQSTNSLP